jgi:hypothetical protein
VERAVVDDVLAPRPLIAPALDDVPRRRHERVVVGQRQEVRRRRAQLDDSVVSSCAVIPTCADR